MADQLIISKVRKAGVGADLLEKINGKTLSVEEAVRKIKAKPMPNEGQKYKMALEYLKQKLQTQEGEKREIKKSQQGNATQILKSIYESKETLAGVESRNQRMQRAMSEVAKASHRHFAQASKKAIACQQKANLFGRTDKQQYPTIHQHLSFRRKLQKSQTLMRQSEMRETQALSAGAPKMKQRVLSVSQLIAPDQALPRLKSLSGKRMTTMMENQNNNQIKVIQITTENRRRIPTTQKPRQNVECVIKTKIQLREVATAPMLQPDGDKVLKKSGTTLSNSALASKAKRNSSPQSASSRRAKNRSQDRNSSKASSGKPQFLKFHRKFAVMSRKVVSKRNHAKKVRFQIEDSPQSQEAAEPQPTNLELQPAGNYI